MYEHRTTPPLPRWRFLRRMAYHFAATLAIILFSLALGMAGYRYYEGLGWDDAFLNAAMLLGGMGPVHTPVNHSGKIFAGLYALYAGLVFLVAAGILVSPVVHRILHRFHWEREIEAEQRKKR